MTIKTSQTQLRKKLEDWVGERSQREAAASINTPLRTLAGWLAGTHKIRGLLAAYLDLWHTHGELRSAHARMLDLKAKNPEVGP